MVELTPAVADAIADNVRRGVPAEVTIQALGIAPSTLSSWISDADRDVRQNGRAVSPERRAAAVALVEKLARARAEHEQEVVQKLLSWTNPKTGADDWRQYAWYLEHGPSRTRWYRNEQRTVTGEVNHLVELQTLQGASLPELERIIDVEAPALAEPQPEPKPKRKPGLPRRRVR